MSRSNARSREEIDLIAAQVAILRADGVQWKSLALRFRVCNSRLRKICQISKKRSPVNAK